MGTGFIKCIPMTLSTLLVFEAILVIEMEEVLVAKIQFSGANLSISDIDYESVVQTKNLIDKYLQKKKLPYVKVLV